MRAGFILLLLLLTAGPALATEYWSGYDTAGNRVEIVVRHAERLHEGADVLIRDVARSTQAEGTAVAVEYSGPARAKVEVRVNGGSRICDVSR